MKLIVRRQLKDYDAWQAMVTDADPTRREYGSLGGRAYRNAQDPNEVYLVFEWDDAKPYQAYFERPDVQEALQASGTTEVIEVSDSFPLDI
jgi:quinol monooxygenase YgiN